MKNLILALLFAALAMPVAAMACPGGNQMGQGMGQGAGMKGGHFAQMDSNGDGVITAEEHAAGAAQRFSAMDANSDGKVTTDEMKSRWKAKHAKNCPFKGDCPQGKDCPMKGDCPAGKDCPKNRGA